MKENFVYKFKIVSDTFMVRNIKDKYTDDASGMTPRIIITIEDLESGALYDLAAPKNKNKDGKYSSLTLAVRRLYALVSGKPKNKIIALSKKTYNHERWGESIGYNINLIEPGESSIK